MALAAAALSNSYAQRPPYQSILFFLISPTTAATTQVWGGGVWGQNPGGVGVIIYTNLSSSCN